MILFRINAKFIKRTCICKILVYSNVIKRFYPEAKLLKEPPKMPLENLKAGVVQQYDPVAHQEAAQSAHLPLSSDPTQSLRVEDYVMHKSGPTVYQPRNDIASAKPLQTIVDKHADAIARIQACESTGPISTIRCSISDTSVTDKSSHHYSSSSSVKAVTPLEQQHKDALASIAHNKTLSVIQEAYRYNTQIDPERTGRMLISNLDKPGHPVSQTTHPCEALVPEQPTTKTPEGVDTEERVPAPGSYSRPFSLSFSGIIHPLVSTRVCSAAGTPTVHIRKASYSANKRDKQTTDPQAQVNNPPSPHPQLQRGQCPKLDCLDKFPCGPLVSRKAIGHATQGYPPAEPGKKNSYRICNYFKRRSKTAKYSFL